MTHDAGAEIGHLIRTFRAGRTSTKASVWSADESNLRMAQSGGPWDIERNAVITRPPLQ